jgi:hypothetical protein
MSAAESAHGFGTTSFFELLGIFSGMKEITVRIFSVLGELHQHQQQYEQGSPDNDSVARGFFCL